MRVILGNTGNGLFDFGKMVNYILKQYQLQQMLLVLLELSYRPIIH